MAKYSGVIQNNDGSWSYRIKKKINGQAVDIKTKKDENGNVFLTARDAYEARIRQENLLKSGEVKLPKNKASVSFIYEAYMNSSEAKQKAPATLRKQISMWKNHISVVFGEKDINSILITDLNDFLFNMYQTHSYAYTEGFLKFFYLLFGYAYRLELIDGDKYYRMFGNSKTRLTMPVKEQADIEDELEGATVYDDSQLAAINKVFQSEDGNLLPAFYFGIYCGLRISEVFALRWSNINWEEGTITVNRQMHNVDGKITLSKVKTMTAIRTVIMPSFLQDYLDSLFQQRREERGQQGKNYKATENVYDEVVKEWISGGDFINRKSNGELLTVNSMKYWSKKIKAVYDIDFKFHNLRHTYATNCAFANMNVLLLMQMLGHKKIDTTRKYYLNIDAGKYKNKVLKTLNGLYDFQDILPVNEKPKDYIETIDSKGRKTKYVK